MALLVQSASNTAASGTGLTVSLGQPTAQGNCVIVCAGATQGTTNPVISGILLGSSAGNFASAKSLNNNAETDAEIWDDFNCAGGQTSVVITFTAGSGTSQGMAAWVMEWSGLAASSPADKTNGASASGVSSFSSGSSGTLTQPAELIIGAVMADGNGQTITGPSSPWVNLAQVSPISGVGLMAGYMVVTATTAQTYSGTLSASSLYTAVIATFKLAAAAPGGAPLIPPAPFTPVNWRRQSWPVAPPFTVSSGDSAAGADGATAGPLPGTGQVLIPPRPFTPMAFRTRPVWQPQALPLRESSDTGSAADSGAVRVTAADTGTGADAGLISQEADTGTGAEAGTVTATVPAADTGTGADSAVIGGVDSSDTGAGAEGAGSITVRPLLMVRWSAADKLSKSGGTMG